MIIKPDIVIQGHIGIWRQRLNCEHLWIPPLPSAVLAPDWLWVAWSHYFMQITFTLYGHRLNMLAQQQEDSWPFFFLVVVVISTLVHTSYFVFHTREQNAPNFVYLAINCAAMQLQKIVPPKNYVYASIQNPPPEVWACEELHSFGGKATCNLL